MQAAAPSDDPHAFKSAPSASSANLAGPASKTYRSADLFQGEREIWIEHRGELYRLRITSTGKLYLTK